MKRIVALTTACVDIFQDTKEIQPGGEAVNFITNCTQYQDIKCFIVGAIGNDMFGDLILDNLKETSVCLEGLHVEEGVTANNKIFRDENGDRYFKEGSWTGGVYETFQLSSNDKGIIKSGDIVHTTGYCPNFADVLALKSENNFLLSVDFNVRRDFETMQQYLPKVDFYFISGDEETIEVLKKWSFEYDTIFIATLAQKGSVAYFHGKETRCNSIRVEKIIDTTGCGDSYQAGFIANYIINRDIKQAMEAGTRHATETLGHVGGIWKKKVNW